MTYTEAKNIINATIIGVTNNKLSIATAEIVKQAWDVYGKGNPNDKHNTSTPVHCASSCMGLAIEELTEFGGCDSWIEEIVSIKRKLDADIGNLRGVHSKRLNQN